MTITYDDSLPDDISLVRFNIGDTVENKGPRPNEGNFSDNEITALIAQQGDVKKVTAYLFDVLATEWTKYAISYTIGPRKEELYRISSRYETKSREWAIIAGVQYTSFAGGLIRRTNGSSEHS